MLKSLVWAGLGSLGLVEVTAWFVNTRGFMIASGSRRWALIIVWILLFWPAGLWLLLRHGETAGPLLFALYVVWELRLRRLRARLGHTESEAWKLGREGLGAPESRAGNHAGDLQLSRVEIRHPRFPTGAEPLEFLYLSDLHFGPYAPSWHWEGIREAVARFNLPIVFGGDLVNEREQAGAAGEFMKALGPGRKAWAVRGNHDHWEEVEATDRALGQAGFRVLVDQGEAWPGREGIRVHGSDDCAPARQGLPRAPGPFSILFCHVPDRFFEAQAMGFDLVVCGHTHGGQIHVPLFGELAVPSRHDRVLSSGFFRKENCFLWIGRGLGGPGFFRWGAKPEILHFIVKGA